ncbi:MAG: methionyl-tRNA formyltransferase [Candidatus Omnitrophota bacterium]
MRIRNIAILTSKKSWFIPYVHKLVNILREKGCQSKLFFNHRNIGKSFQTTFILSYFNKIDERFLKKHKHNLVVHESNLPKGRGWAPLSWQILEGKKKIPIVLFEASERIDGGGIYIKDYISYKGNELYPEIREKQAIKTIELCLRFLKDYKNIAPLKQRGKPTYYKKRSPEDSRLDIHKSIKDQFNLLRVVSNEEFPAFFYCKGHKYILRIDKDD